ncbi:MAG: hypothetical protein SGPRY_000364 [Prymnesium sp.]
MPLPSIIASPSLLPSSAPQPCTREQPTRTSAAGLLRLWGLSGRNATTPVKLAAARPPPCRPVAAHLCENLRRCDCGAAAQFYENHTSNSQQLDVEGNFSALRVFFLDGHSGPMNDMISFLNDVLQIPAESLDGMVFLQAKKHSIARDADAQLNGWPALEFSWLANLYPKSWECYRVREPKPQASSNSTSDRQSSETGKPGSKRKLPRRRVKSTACGYRYSDVAAHPFAVLLPYSVHSYGLVQAYSMGLPILAPSLSLLSSLHHRTGFMGHKARGVYLYLSSSVLIPSLVHCLSVGRSVFLSPNDGCSVGAAAMWLQLADFYQWYARCRDLERLDVMV